MSQAKAITACLRITGLITVIAFLFSGCNADPVCLFNLRDLLPGEGSISRLPGLSVPANEFTIDGDTIFVLTYTNSSNISRDMALISSDGYSIGDSDFKWEKSPHFFRCVDYAIVIYTGNNSQMLRNLEEILGPQFAGAPY
jgi:hypothetical protein